MITRLIEIIKKWLHTVNDCKCVHVHAASFGSRLQVLVIFRYFTQPSKLSYLLFSHERLCHCKNISHQIGVWSKIQSSITRCLILQLKCQKGYWKLKMQNLLSDIMWISILLRRNILDVRDKIVLRPWIQSTAQKQLPPILCLSIYQFMSTSKLGVRTLGFNSCIAIMWHSQIWWSSAWCRRTLHRHLPPFEIWVYQSPKPEVANSVIKLVLCRPNVSLEFVLLKRKKSHYSKECVICWRSNPCFYLSYGR